MQHSTLRYAACGVLAAVLTACGGGSSSTADGGSGNSGGTTAQYGSVPLVVSDASSQDWALIGVNVLSIALVPASGSGGNVTVYTAPSGGTPLNLEQLDNLGDLLANVSVPVGTYGGAIVTVSGNPGDVQLTASAEPEAGFALAAGTVVSSQNIQIQHAQGTAPNLTVPIDVTFVSPLVVAANATAPLDIEFDLSHPAFIIGHQPPAAGTLLWAVNFKGPVRHHPVADIARLVLRHVYGNVTAVASGGSTITITRDFPTEPVVTPETAVASSQQLTIGVDSTNGTLLYDVDTGTSSTVTSFPSSLLNANGNTYARIAARYQEDGTLVATRIWTSSSFNSVYISPEGHVLHVDTANNIVTVTNELGLPVRLQINDQTQFYFRQPWSALADATPIGTGSTFLRNADLVRGFKVHTSVVNPLAVQPWVAQSIDIETAAYSGTISNTNNTGFTYTHDYVSATDDYHYAIDYIASSSANGNDPLTGAAIGGFKWWNFAFPTLLTDGSSAVSDFIAATNGTVSFGGNASAITAVGESGATWADAANPTGWSAPWAILDPVPLPLASVATGIANSAFTITVSGGTQPVTVDFNASSGSATLIYQVDRTNGIVTVTPIDISTSGGLATFAAAITAGTPVKVYGIPQSDGTLQSYVIDYFTGSTMPAS